MESRCLWLVFGRGRLHSVGKKLSEIDKEVRHRCVARSLSYSYSSVQLTSSFQNDQLSYPWLYNVISWCLATASRISILLMVTCRQLVNCVDQLRVPITTTSIIWSTESFVPSATDLVSLLFADFFSASRLYQYSVCVFWMWIECVSANRYVYRPLLVCILVFRCFIDRNTYPL